jgi:hypothetical protein
MPWTLLFSAWLGVKGRVNVKANLPASRIAMWWCIHVPPDVCRSRTPPSWQPLVLGPSTVTSDCHIPQWCIAHGMTITACGQLPKLLFLTDHCQHQCQCQAPDMELAQVHNWLQLVIAVSVSPVMKGRYVAACVLELLRAAGLGRPFRPSMIFVVPGAWSLP